MFRHKAEKRIVELSLGKVRLMRADDLTSQAGGGSIGVGENG